MVGCTRECRKLKQSYRLNLNLGRPYLRCLEHIQEFIVAIVVLYAVQPSCANGWMVTNTRQLTNGLQEIECHFDADGTLIVYRRSYGSPSASDIWVVSPFGFDGTPVLTESVGEYSPTFHPDGRITYVQYTGGSDDIWILDMDSGERNRLVDGPLEQANPCWHPNGQRLAFYNEYQNNRSQIYLANADGTPIGPRTGAADGYAQSMPIYSHSGDRIAYVSYPVAGAQPEVWVMSEDGSGKQRIATGAPGFWWPDDSYLGYVRNGQVWLQPFHTGQPIGDAEQLQFPDLPADAIVSGAGVDLATVGLQTDQLMLVFALEGLPPYPQYEHLWIGIVGQMVPTADAGDNVEILSAAQAVTVICGTGSDWESDPLEYRWLEGEMVLLDWTSVSETGQCCLDLGFVAALSIGNHTLTLEVREVGEGGLSASDDMILTVQNSPPEAQPGPAVQTVQVGIDPVRVVADVADFDGDTLSYTWLKDGQSLGAGVVETMQGGDPVAIPDLFIAPGDIHFPVQETPHVIELVVSDELNDPVKPSVLVIVIDTQAPTLSPVPSVTILWPPNHELQPVTIAANAFDNGGGAITLAVAVESSQPPDTTGDGNTIPDYYIDSIDDETGIIELRLRSERAGTGDGRMYTITITATDESGNSSKAVVTIRAPHDKRKK